MIDPKAGAQDTFYVGNLKGVGRVYQQTFIDTYAKVAFVKLYDRKTPITAADLLNDRVIPFFDSHEMKLLRMLTDRGSEYCGNPERHEYELYLAVEDVDHTRTKTKSPQTTDVIDKCFFSRLSMEGVLRLLAVTEDRRSQRCICAWSPFRWGRGAVKPRSPRSGAPQAQGLTAPSRAQRSSHAANARNLWTPERRRPILLWRTGDRVAKSRA